MNRAANVPAPDSKEPLLLLVHRIPYPPNKGDKIRSFHLLEALAETYSVRLGCFVDDPDDWQYVDALAVKVDKLKLLPLGRWQGKLRSLSALVRNQALSLPYYRDAEMQRWVDAQRDCKKIVIFSSTMAQYVDDRQDCTRVADFVDVDSDKWSQYAASKSWPWRLVYSREAKKLLRFERAIAEQFSATAFVTEAETALFARLAPSAANKLITVANGVDADYFVAQPAATSPYGANGGAPVVVFTGAMDYWANADAVLWFARSVWGQVRQAVPNAELYIVGGNPSAEVLKLAEREGVTVTGRVSDIRPYTQYAAVSIAPLRIARGVQNKVIEALALEKPVIASHQAAEGLAGDVADISGLTVIATDQSGRWASAVVDHLTAARPNSGGRDYVLREYNWQKNLAGLLQALKTSKRRATAAASKVPE